MKKYILAIDQGTTSSRAILFDKEGNLVYKKQQNLELEYSEKGWVSVNPTTLWEMQHRVIVELLKENNVLLEEIDSIGITNQRETTILWNAETGEPIETAIVWQCKRTASYCEKLSKLYPNDFFTSKTGLHCDPYFSASKIKWLIDNDATAMQWYQDGKLAFGTVDSWLIYKLTNHSVHATDMSNASRTLLFNINTQKFDKELLKVFELEKLILPIILNSSDNFGIAKVLSNQDDVLIAGVLGDQQAALFGQKCFTKGDLKITYGTGAFVLFNTGKKPIYSKQGLLTSIGWKINDEITYVLEGSILSCGTVVSWLKNNLGIIDDVSEIDAMCAKVSGNGGVYFVPAFTGLGAPYWNSNAIGTIIGLTLDTNKNHIVKSGMESIGYLVDDVLHAMRKDSNLAISHINVDGGVANSDFLMKFQAELSKTLIKRPNSIEATALGAAYIAGLYTQFWPNLDALQAINASHTTFESQNDKHNNVIDKTKWNLAITNASNW